jgi:GNAT superfamily N-acetyltransferase
MFSRNSSGEKPSFEIVATESAEIAARLGAEIAERFGPRDESPLSIAIRDGAGALIGGLNGVIHWRWLYIRHVWVEESRRGEGLATKLMEMAEETARGRGALGAYIDTFDPKVAGFYERLGYSPVGSIADFPPGGRRIFLSKRLAGEGAK